MFFKTDGTTVCGCNKDIATARRPCAPSWSAATACYLCQRGCRDPLATTTAHCHCTSDGHRPWPPDAWTTNFHFDMYFTKMDQGNLDRNRERHDHRQHSISLSLSSWCPCSRTARKTSDILLGSRAEVDGAVVEPIYWPTSDMRTYPVGFTPPTSRLHLAAIHN